MNTELHYLYRDASNYKQGTLVVFPGEFTEADLQRIAGALDDGQFFIPSQVGQRDLQRDLSSKLYEDDHVWHELNLPGDVALTDRPPTVTESFSDFAARFEGITWDIERAIAEVGLGDDEHGEDGGDGLGEAVREPVPAPARSASLRDALGPGGRSSG